MNNPKRSCALLLLVMFVSSCGISQEQIYTHTATAATTIAALWTLTPSPSLTATKTSLPTSTQTITPTDTPTLTPTPSHGEWIAFKGTDYNIWLIHPDGTGITQITPDGNSENPYHDPKWSPDGRQLAFMQGNGYKLPIQLWGYSLINNKAQILEVEISSGFDWSPDSRTIVFDTPSEGLWFFDISTRTKKYFAGNELSNNLREPQWSPDGSYIIAFTGIENNKNDTAYSFSTTNHSVSKAKYSIKSCDWSPDGKTIVCVLKSRTDVFGLYNPDLSIQSLIAYPTSVGVCKNQDWGYPIWSPNGLYISFEFGCLNPFSVGGFILSLYPNYQWKGAGFVTGWSPDNKNILVIDIWTIFITDFFDNSVLYQIAGANGAWQP